MRALLISLLPIIFLIGASPHGIAKKLRTRLTPKKESFTLNSTSLSKRDSTESIIIEPADSATMEEITTKIIFSGFDKPAGSLRETFCITNSSDLLIRSLTVSLIYSDPQGRMLHQRSETINVEIPPGETRTVNIKSYDPQRTLYYIKSRPPRNGGQPFIISITLESIGL